MYRGIKEWRRPRRPLMVVCSATSLICMTLQLVLGFPWQAAFGAFAAAFCLVVAYVPEVKS
jgi:hypothetical protein